MMAVLGLNVMGTACTGKGPPFKRSGQPCGDDDSGVGECAWRNRGAYVRRRNTDQKLCGVTALIVLLAVGCIPVLKLACMSVLYKLAAAVAEPVADKRIVGCIKSMAQGGVLYLKLGLLWHCTVFLLRLRCRRRQSHHMHRGTAMNAYMRGFVILFVLLVLLSYLPPGKQYRKYIRFYAQL